VDAAAPAALIPIAGRALARERSAARQTSGIEAYGKSVWFWHPWLVSNRRRFSQAQPGLQNRQFADDGGKRNSSPGRARHKPSNHCAGNAGMLRLYLYARVRLYHHLLHTGPRVQQAPGIPCALLLGRNGWQSPGETRRGKVKVCSPSSSALCAIAHWGGRSSIPETPAIEPIGRGVLDTPPARGMTVGCGKRFGLDAAHRPRNNRPNHPR
jgi:hypothetical protein